MGASVSRKLTSSFEGALAGGGDPATSPLYVFGPFLKLIVVAGVAHITFGATVWLAVFTVFVVSMVYRQVMVWVTDGSGGSGLSEEEFGGWAVKINAGITMIEYMLTFLVSMAALVTFIADRFPILNDHIAWFQYRVFLAVTLSVITGWIVNLGPRISARAFGPATAAVMALLWVMVFATIYKTGFHLPNFDPRAFSFSEFNYVGENNQIETSSYINLTFAGYARILALMTGIEIFANLVAAYEGKRAEKSRKAFGSLIMIMGTTVIAMLIVGPAILAHADPLNEHVSVFTQTMDFLLPPVVSYVGTLIGVAVLLSACAAAAQGIQNLSLGMRYRHYVPAKFGQRNKHDVASLPVWIMVAVAGGCFILFGTREETYLALYAAGVFILLSMTGWAASKRLIRELSADRSFKQIASLAGAVSAALLTTFATIVIFEERFFDGAWSYLLMVPVFYFGFGYYRRHLGAPPSVEDRLGLVVSGQGYVPQTLYANRSNEARFRRILVPLSGAVFSEQVLPMVRSIARCDSAEIDLLIVCDEETADRSDNTKYLQSVAALLNADGVRTRYIVDVGEAATTIDRFAESTRADLIAMTSSGGSAARKVISESIAKKVIKKTLTPTLVIRPIDDWHARYSNFNHILVALDGSEAAESVLPYIFFFTAQFGSRVLLISVPEGSESEDFETNIRRYLNGIADRLKKENVEVDVLFGGSGPARTIVATSEEKDVDLIMMASHGRGGTERSKIHLGSVSEKVMDEARCPVFVVPLTTNRDS